MQTQVMLVFLGLLLIPGLIIAIILRIVLLLNSHRGNHVCPFCHEARLRSYPATSQQRFWAALMFLSCYKHACPVCGFNRILYTTAGSPANSARHLRR